MSAEGNLLHVALYCRDVLKFAEAFLDRTQIGVQRMAPRSLDALAQGEEGALSIEDGNRRILGQSFFLRGFATVREMQEATGGPIFCDIWPDIAERRPGHASPPWTWNPPIL